MIDFGSVKWNPPHMKKKANRTFCFSFSVACVLGGLSTHIAIPQETSAETNPDASSRDLAVWIDDLESNTYTVRVRATEQLIGAGMVAVKPVTEAVEQGGLETIARCMYVLRQLALAGKDDTTRQTAYAALERISARRFTGAARRAASALATVHQVRQQNAQSQLVKRGALFSVTTVTMANRIHQRFMSVYLGPKWRGTESDLEQLTWITRTQDGGPQNHWMIILDGKQVTDEWVELVVNLDNIAVIKIKSASITDESAGQLATMNHLQVLELLYNRTVTDAAFESFSKLEQVDRFRLIGNKMTQQGKDAFDKRMNRAEIDFRQGGFLGVGCESNPCRIKQVQANSVAAAAGLRIGDVISGYNNQPVQTMNELTELIAEHAVGETVTIELQRGNERIVKEVTLGAWD